MSVSFFLAVILIVTKAGLFSAVATAFIIEA